MYVATQTADQLRALARSNREELRTAIVEELMPATVDALRDALQPREKCDVCQQFKRPAARWAVLAVLKAAKLIGAETQVAVFLTERFGVRNEQELEQIVATGKRMASLAETPPAVMLHDALEVVKLCVRQEPHLAAEARRALEGLSSAEEVNGTP